MTIKKFFQNNSEELFYNSDLINNLNDEFKDYVECARNFSHSVFDVDMYPERIEEAKKLFSKSISSPLLNKEMLISIINDSFKKLYSYDYQNYLDNQKIESEIDLYLKTINNIGSKLLNNNTQQKNISYKLGKFNILFIVFLILIVPLYYIGFKYLLDNHIMMQFTDYEDIQRYLNFKYRDITSAFMLIYALIYVPITFAYKNLIKKLPFYYIYPFFISTLLWVLNFFSVAMFNPNLQLGMKMFCIFMAPSVLSTLTLLLIFIVGIIHTIIIKYK